MNGQDIAIYQLAYTSKFVNVIIQEDEKSNCIYLHFVQH